MSEKILVVFPHPDDEAFGLSGTLAKFVAEGAQVTYACLTLGEMGRALGNPPIANRESLPLIRKEELIASCQAIGIQDLRMLGFMDKTVEFEPKEVVDAAIRSIYEEVKPTLVFTFFPGYSVHPDHDATGASVIRVLQELPAEERPKVLCIGFSHNMVQDNGEPDVSIDITNYLVQKRNAIAAHQSQFQISEMFGNEDIHSEEVKQRFGKEKFWTYSFQ
ncbi:bacillithiol biosynthesis deacetylase BshB2 [Paenibacillus camelliae]|uniref:bacillithiol biosynthesis deacetylase BshB2 n=1 Tax=Paenibacillus camelliae TaxID=512410 RepID=UPI00203D0FC1|nr:bacillithiol biosynthesis deacetylase BshB2 [Paenibacillus camelliae]MCM3634181.1 bacillithiol biosynthesis deacetylase BshB2 [Paenibacillus camelliae]